MTTYNSNDYKQAAQMASEDAIWTKGERAILARIAKLMTDDEDHELQKEEFGSGTIYGVKGSSIQFLFHVGAPIIGDVVTTNIGRA